MQIQWFPGHMTKSLRMIEENVSAVDAIGYLLDARAPFACFNPAFDKILQGLPCLFILNKADLADPKITDKWLSFFAQKGNKAIAVSSTASKSKKLLTDSFNSLRMPKVERMSAKGVYRPKRVMVVGVPNSGKSTLINCLASAGLAKTGDKPGVTRGKQWVRLAQGLELLDTPGTLWSKFEIESVARHLYFIGSIRNEVVDEVQAARLLLQELSADYPKEIEVRYGFNPDQSSVDTVEAVCKRRGYLVAGNEYDLLRGAQAVFDDFRKGKLGRITLERP